MKIDLNVPDEDLKCYHCFLLECTIAFMKLNPDYPSEEAITDVASVLGHAVADAFPQAPPALVGELIAEAGNVAVAMVATIEHNRKQRKSNEHNHKLN